MLFTGGQSDEPSKLPGSERSENCDPHEVGVGAGESLP